MIRVGLIRVISGLPPKQLDSHANLLQKLLPDTHVVTIAIKGFPQGIHNLELARQAVPEIVRVGLQLAPSVDVLVVSCADEPGVNELHERCRLPVLGAGSCLAAVFSGIAGQIGVLTMTSHLPAPLSNTWEGRWISIQGVDDTTDLDSAEREIIQSARQLLDEGANALALACTGFCTNDIAATLANRLKVPVLDPIRAVAVHLAGASMILRNLTKGR